MFNGFINSYIMNPNPHHFHLPLLDQTSSSQNIFNCDQLFYENFECPVKVAKSLNNNVIMPCKNVLNSKNSEYVLVKIENLKKILTHSFLKINPENYEAFKVAKLHKNIEEKNLKNKSNASLSVWDNDNKTKILALLLNICETVNDIILYNVRKFQNNICDV